MRKTAKDTDTFEPELDDFGRRPSWKKRVLYFVLALFVTSLPAILFVRIFVVDVLKAQLTLYTGILISAAVLSLAYHNLTFSQGARIRENANPPTKSSFKGKKDQYEAALVKHEQSIASAAFAYSLAYNNAIFLLAAPFVGCYVFADKVGGDINALLSTAAAAGLALFNSRSALKAIGE